MAARLKQLFITFTLVTALAAVADGALSLIGMGDPVLLVADTHCGYAMKPNQNHFRFFVHTKVNSNSMRSAEISGPKAPGVLRLLFIGDSITYGTTRVDQHDIFTEVLNRELPNVVNRQVQVLNASASAWAIGNELGYLQTRGTFESDIVVLVLNDGDLSQRFSTTKEVGSQLYFTKPKCALCELITHFTNHQTADKGTAEAHDHAQEQDNLRDLSAFHALVSAKSSRMVVLFVPFRKNIRKPKQKVLQPLLTAWAQSSNVPIVDATGDLERLSIPEASIDGGTHLSVKGNAAVAEAFVRYAGEQLVTTIPAKI